jgi:hypothetical protein
MQGLSRLQLLQDGRREAAWPARQVCSLKVLGRERVLLHKRGVAPRTDACVCSSFDMACFDARYTPCAEQLLLSWLLLLLLSSAAAAAAAFEEPEGKLPMLPTESERVNSRQKYS